jgi:hypothetical protein
MRNIKQLPHTKLLPGFREIIRRIGENTMAAPAARMVKAAAGYQELP